MVKRQETFSLVYVPLRSILQVALALVSSYLVWCIRYWPIYSLFSDLGLILSHSWYLNFILQWSTVTVGEVAITIVIILPVAEFSEHRAQTLLIPAPVILTGTPEKTGVRLDAPFEFSIRRCSRWKQLILFYFSLCLLICIIFQHDYGFHENDESMASTRLNFKSPWFSFLICCIIVPLLSIHLLLNQPGCPDNVVKTVSYGIRPRCGDGSYLDVASYTCKTCPAGTWSHGASFCSPCNAGLHASQPISLP